MHDGEPELLLLLLPEPPAIVARAARRPGGKQNNTKTLHDSPLLTLARIKQDVLVWFWFDGAAAKRTLVTPATYSQNLLNSEQGCTVMCCITNPYQVSVKWSVVSSRQQGSNKV